MSLSSALNTATIGLSTLQQQSAVLSANVANANNADYSRKTVQLTTYSTGGMPQAATVASITRVSSSLLSGQYFSALADMGLSTRRTDYSTRLAEMLGTSDSSGGQTPIASALSGFTDALSDLEATPEDAGLKGALLTKAQDLLNAIKKAAAAITAEKAQAQSDIESDITTINTAAANIDKLNSRIVGLKASGQDASDLEDQRDAELAKLASLTDIQYSVNDRGAMNVYTKSGVQIVGATAQSFQYDRSSGRITNSTGNDVTAGLSGGQLQSALDFLNTGASAVASSDPNLGAAQKYSNQLDALATSLYSVVNNAYDDPSTTAVEEFFTFDPSAPSGTGDASRIILAVDSTTLDASLAGSVRQALETTQLAASDTNPAGFETGLRLSGITLAGFVSGIGAYHARTVSDNQAAQDSAENLKSTAEVKLQSNKGVDIDTELANLQVLQNNYAALANVLNSITQMFDDLMSIGR